MKDHEKARQQHRLMAWAGLLGLLGVGAVWSCSSDTNNPEAPNATSGGGSSGNRGIGGAIGGLPSETSNGAENQGNEGVCGQDTRTLQRTPLDMFVLVDKSGSTLLPLDVVATDNAVFGLRMKTFDDGKVQINLKTLTKISTTTTTTKITRLAGPASLAEVRASFLPRTLWATMTSSLLSFLNSPAMAGTQVGMQFFPAVSIEKPSEPDCDAISSDATSYTRPALEFRALPEAAGAISTAVEKVFPFGSTPTGPALQGSYEYVTGWAKAHPDHRSVLLLVTDGDPTDCTGELLDDPGVENIRQRIATSAAGSTGVPGITTYVLGLGGLNNLNAFARAGSGRDAFLVGITPNLASDLATTFDQIRKETASCDFAFPQNPPFPITNVRVSQNLSSNVSPLPYAIDAAACLPTGGWYYDIPLKDGTEKPTKVTLCPTSCETARTDPTASVSVLFTCEPVINLH